MLISGNGAAHSATLLHSLVAINSNTTDPSGPPATLIEVVNGGEAYQDRWDIFSEETTGSQQIPYDVGTGALLDFSGTGQTVVLAGGGPPVDNGTFYPPQTINGGAVNAVPGAGSLSLGGINWAGLPGAADLGLAGNSATGGRYNSSIPMGGWAAGLGFVMGPDIQHPYAWCSNLDPICFEVDRIDTSKQLTRVFSVSGNGDTSLHAATASSLEIGGDAALSAAPRLLYSAFIPGLSEPVTVATWIPDKAIMVTRIEAQAQIPPSACATNAVVELADGAESQLLTVTQSGNDSGPVSFAGPAGTQLVLSVATAAAGCATVPSAVNVIVQYRMQ